MKTVLKKTGILILLQCKIQNNCKKLLPICNKYDARESSETLFTGKKMLYFGTFTQKISLFILFYLGNSVSSVHQKHYQTITFWVSKDTIK